jgi:uncharacterized protein YndB with AHSA1/START domain
MRKALAVIGALVLVSAAVVLVLAAMKPDTFRVARSTSIKAPPEKIFDILSDFHRSPEWSPYEKKDPDMKRSFSGSDRGKGAAYAWQGDSTVGSGRLEIADASRPHKVTINLDMIKPIAAHNIVEFTLEPRADSTNVTWVMTGQVPFLAKIAHVFFNVDRMVGGDFETGLASLKALAEK